MVLAVVPLSACLLLLMHSAGLAEALARGQCLSPTALAVTADGQSLFIACATANRFNNDVSILDLASQSEADRMRVRREPVAAALSRDGRFLFVANCLPTGRADVERVSAVVSVLDLVAGGTERELILPNGSTALADLRLSPDGRHGAATHLVASFNRAATQVSLGWMNANALTVFDAENHAVVGTVLLDSPRQGAGNPWGLAWSPDGATLVVAHAGTHEVSVIDFPQRPG
jgi:DNA-binding beta-propeller fold protein YncE